MPTPTYDSYADDLSADTRDRDAWGNTITYSIVNSQIALGGISYYPTTGDEYNNFASAFISAHPDAVANIDAAILDITAGSFTDDYAVLFSNVAN
ncbi:MAG TPA: hypothetical protein VL625_08050, partial [Patescibacteria group bacterium]|nr:hypothetical protein [Patescibacteria group bacterium]